MDQQLITPGTTASDLHSSISVGPLQSGKYAVADYIKSRAKLQPENIDALLNEPKDFKYGNAVWLFEHMRQICRDLTLLLAVLRSNNCCTSKECPEMRVTDQFHFLCAAHVGT